MSRNIYPALAGVRSARIKLDNYRPSIYDYHGAQRSLVRLQRTYNLSIAEIVSGSTFGRPSLPLSQQEVVDIGAVNLEGGDVDTAIDWLEGDRLHREPPQARPQDVSYRLSKAYAMVSV